MHTRCEEIWDQKQGDHDSGVPKLCEIYSSLKTVVCSQDRLYNIQCFFATETCNFICFFFRQVISNGLPFFYFLTFGGTSALVRSVTRQYAWHIFLASVDGYMYGWIEVSL